MPVATHPEPRLTIVDDDPAVLNSLKFALETEGFAVRSFRTGADALDASDSIKSGCLVIDYHLPDMNGLDLLQKLRSRKVSIPALLITSHPSLVLRERASAAGAPIIEKPLFGNLLMDAIRSALARSAAILR